MNATVNSLIARSGVVIILVLLCVLAFAPPGVSAQDASSSSPDEQTAAATFTQLQKLLAADGAASDAFGLKVAISGNTLLIGSPLSDISGKSDQGAVYVYVNENGAWSQQAKLAASDGNTDGQFGYALAIDGDTIVIGARRTDPTNRGAAYVFVRSGAQWSQQAKFTGNDSVNGDRFAEAVAISGNTIVVGAPLHDVAGTPNVNKGAAYIYTRTGATWSQQAKLTAGEPRDFDFFGSDVAIDGNTVLICAPNSNGDVQLGAAYVFTRSGVTWSQQAKLQSNDIVSRDGFGTSASLSGDTAVVGAFAVTVSRHLFQGAAYVFTRSGASWSQQAKLTADDGANSSFFGYTVSLKNQTLVIGALGDRIDGKLQQGSIYLFTRTGQVWSQQAKFIASDGAAGDRLGTSVAVDGNFIVAGAPQKDVNLFNTVDTQQRGIAQVFSTSAGDKTPKILAVSVKGKKLIVMGMNFEPPSEIYVNGQKQKKTSNDEQSPTTTVIAAKAGRLIAPGQTVVVQIKNSNTGMTSNEFFFTRPLD